MKKSLKKKRAKRVMMKRKRTKKELALAILTKEFIEEIDNE